MRLLLLLLSLCLVVSCQRSTKTADQAMAHADSVIGNHTDLLFSNPQQAIRVFDTLQSQLTDSAAWYKAEVFKATAHNLMGDTCLANRLYVKVERWSQSMQPRQLHLEGLVWNHRGVNAMMVGNTPLAQSCYQQAYKFLDTPPKPKELISTAINLADICLQTGQIPLAAKHYREALFLCDSMGDTRNRSSVCCGLAQVYTELQRFSTAHAFFNEAARNITHESQQTQFFYHFSLGNCYYYEKRYNEALASFKQARVFAELFANPLLMCNCDANMAEIYLMQDHLDLAEQHLSRCKEMLTQHPEQLPQQNTFYIRSLLADLAIARGHRAQAAAIMPQNSDSFFVTSPRYLMLHYRRLQHYAERDGLWHEAYTYQSLSDRYADSINSRQSRNAVVEITGRYQRDTTLLRQQLDLTAYATKNVRQQNTILITVSALVAIALLALLIIIYYRRYTNERFKRQVERITALRMDVVRNRVSPHYIFNVLGTVLPKLQRYPEMVQPVEMLIDVLRGNLLTSGKVSVPLCDELQLVRRYVELYHYSHGDYPQVTWEVLPELEQSSMHIPSMSLQIPVENALKHAFPVLTPECAIHILVTIDADDMLVLQITDNGQGYNPGRVKRTGRDTGTGLRLLTRTLEILNQYNHRSASLTIVNVDPPHHGTRTELRLPVGYTYETQKQKNYPPPLVFRKISRIRSRR